jgi:hypothetical protein
MPEESEPVKCLRCETVMTLDEPFYAIPHTKRRGTAPNDQITVDITASRLVRLLWCPNRECRYVEFRTPSGWPPVTPESR